MNGYEIKELTAAAAKVYIQEHHYSHGSHNGPSPCYGLFDGARLIGALLFATPCSENVRSSIFGKDYKEHVTELHRLHIQDETPKNTESWFISRTLKLLKAKKPEIWAVVSFADPSANHTGTIYRATNALYYGRSGKARFYLDKDGRLRHPRQNGVNISVEKAKNMGWKPTIREGKHRYLYLLENSKGHKKWMTHRLKVKVSAYGSRVTSTSVIKT